ncbi:hypothetical protein FRC07_006762 [Ceratobasidium sp. 392]|nr:hypothetical protein FRC07_006762 [Ceratobasidium sp. 392]
MTSNSLLRKNKGLVIKELRCNERRLGVHPNGGTSITFNWSENFLVVNLKLLPDRASPRASYRCVIDREMMKEVKHAGTEYETVFIRLHPLPLSTSSRDGWLHVLGEAQTGHTEISLIITADSRSRTDPHSKAALLWSRFIPWLQRVAYCLLVSQDEMKRLTYPPGLCILELKDGSERFTLQQSSLEQLRKPEWRLNDEVIDLTIGLMRQKPWKENALVIPTGGWLYLEEGIATDVRRQYFSKLSEGDIFNFHVLLIPILVDGIRWMLVAVFYPGQLMRMALTGDASRPNDDPRVIWCQEEAMYDLLGGFTAKHERLLRSVLPYHLGFSRVKNWVQDLLLSVPQQKNVFDSGVYMLQFMNKILSVREGVLNWGELPEQDLDVNWGTDSLIRCRNDFANEVAEASAAWLRRTLI